MAITVYNLTSAIDTNNLSVYTTASITPTARRLVLAYIGGSGVGVASPAPTLAGNGLTWVQVATIEFNVIATPISRLTLFRALGAAPSSGAVTITFSATQDACLWGIVEVSNVDNGGTNGSAAIVQSATNRADAAAALTVTLAAYANANNGAVSGFSHDYLAGITPDTGWTEIHDITGLETQWRANNDTTAVATFASGTHDIAGIAVEIKTVTIAPVIMHQRKMQGMS